MTTPLSDEDRSLLDVIQEWKILAVELADAAQTDEQKRLRFYVLSLLIIQRLSDEHSNPTGDNILDRASSSPDKTMSVRCRWSPLDRAMILTVGGAIRNSGLAVHKLSASGDLQATGEASYFGSATLSASGDL
jgi:hypothetical protein